MSQTALQEYEAMGFISSDIHWLAAGNEAKPSSATGEVVVFSEHLLRSFYPPSIDFFRKVLAPQLLRWHDQRVTTKSPHGGTCRDNLTTPSERYI